MARRPGRRRAGLAVAVFASACSLLSDLDELERGECGAACADGQAGFDGGAGSGGWPSLDASDASGGDAPSSDASADAADADAACAGDHCAECCVDQHPGGFQVFFQATFTCSCSDGAPCKDECADTLCVLGSSSSQECVDCTQQDEVSACITAACVTVECQNARSCLDGCP
jgi:hypothetical protein